MAVFCYIYTAGHKNLYGRYKSTCQIIITYPVPSPILQTLYKKATEVAQIHFILHSVDCDQGDKKVFSPENLSVF